MEILLYRNGLEEIETSFEPNDLPKLLTDKSNLVWVDLYVPTEADRIEADAILRNIFKFHHLTIEDAHETRNQPKIESFPNYLFFIVHGVKHETNSANFVTKELDGYLGENFIVTYHQEEFRSIERVKQNICENTFSCQRGAAFLLHQILDELVDLYIPVVDEFDTAINTLEDRIFKLKRGDNKVLESIMDLKRSVARLRRISSKQLDVLYRMSHGQFLLIDENIQPFYRDVHDHLLRVSDLAENYRDLVSGLLEVHFALIASRTNDVMKVMAIFSAIMLPLSLIAGIYGMNFENMPELKTANGYFIVLGIMLLVAIILMTYFWRKGWIGSEDVSEEEEKN